MIVKLNFNLEAWIKNLQIEADSEEDAIEKLMRMNVADIFYEAGSYESDCTEIDAEIIEYDLVVKASNITYNHDDKDDSDFMKDLLPEELTVTLDGVRDSDDVEELVKDEVFFTTHFEVESLDYQIVMKK